MNDPHVVALIYRVEHGDSIDYSTAKPLVVEEPGFRLCVEGLRARFEFKAHYATAEQARNAIADYIRVWEFDATLKRGNPDSFRLRFETAEIVDRNPTSGALRVSGCLVGEGAGTLSVKLTVSTPNYPSLPSDLAIDPDAETLYGRYMGYRQKREPLPGMAYFCLTVLQHGAGSRKAAARKYGIDIAVLAKLGDLTANRGGAQARKAAGVATELSHQEHRFLNGAVKAIVRRVAERAHAPTGTLPTIALSDLPPLADSVDRGQPTGYPTPPSRASQS